jgi:hypothetical protein
MATAPKQQAEAAPLAEVSTYSEVEWLEAERARITAEEEANAQARLDYMRENSNVPDITPEPEPVPATGASAGTPGTFTPEGATPPADLGACASVTATPATAWATGEHVVLGDSSHAYWDGSAWVAGDAP